MTGASEPACGGRLRPITGGPSDYWALPVLTPVVWIDSM